MTEDSQGSIKKANTFLCLQFLSDFGDNITSALLALCLLDITKSAEKIGLVYFITTLGYVLFTLAGGLLGDKLSKRNILFSADVGRGLVVLLLIIALSEKSILLIYATSFLLSILGSLHRPVKLSTWAESIPNNRLERYNSLSELSIQASTVLAPLIASFFIMKEWANWGFALNGLTFFMCALIYFRVVAKRNNVVATAPAERDIFKGFKLIYKNTEMSKYVIYDAVQMIGFGAFNATFLVLAQRDFGWSKLDYSYHLSIVAVFTTIGALMGATVYMAKMNHVTKLIGCAIASAIALFTMMQIQSFPMSSLLVGICDGLAVLTMTVTKTKVQLIAKRDHTHALTSIIAARYILIKAATLLGTGACLLIDDFISLEMTLTLFVIPIGVSFLPFAMGKEKAAGMAAVPSAIEPGK